MPISINEVFASRRKIYLNSTRIFLQHWLSFTICDHTKDSFLLHCRDKGRVSAFYDYDDDDDEDDDNDDDDDDKDDDDCFIFAYIIEHIILLYMHIFIFVFIIARDYCRFYTSI